MKFFAVAALFAAGALAQPLEALEARDYQPCPSGLYTNAVCASTLILGIIGLDVSSVPKYPTSASDFQAACASLGKQALCCLVPVAEQGVLCQKPVGVQ